MIAAALCGHVAFMGSDGRGVDVDQRLRWRLRYSALWRGLGVFGSVGLFRSMGASASLWGSVRPVEGLMSLCSVAGYGAFGPSLRSRFWLSSFCV